MPKHYLTPVFDFGWLEDNRIVLFESGGGICGSGFTLYDYSHPVKMRQRMLEMLAAKVKTLFIVNTAENVLLHDIREDFLRSENNISYFKNITEFVAHIKQHPQEATDAIIVIDRISQRIDLLENDFAAILAAQDIHIPVVNAGSYKFFDNKVNFSMLFEGELASALPQTFIVNKINYQTVLDTISKKKIAQFVLKSPTSAHALDTVLVAREQLAEVVQIILTNDLEACKTLNTSERNRTHLTALMDSLYDDQRTLVIRELVVPKPVKIDLHDYRCAGRCVFVAVYDDETSELALDHIASFWRPAAKPYREGDPLTHDNLISSATKVPAAPLNKGFFRLTHDQEEQAKTEYSLKTDISTSDFKLIFPQLEHVVQNVLKKIVKRDMIGHVVAFTSSPTLEPSIKQYILHRISSLALKRVSAQFLAYLETRMTHFPLLLVLQFRYDIISSSYFANPNILHTDLYQYINKYFQRILDEERDELAALSKEFVALTAPSRDILKQHLQTASPFLFRYIVVVDQKAKSDEVKSLQHDKQARQSFANRNFLDAAENWQKTFDLLKRCSPKSIEYIICHSNLASCYRDLGNYEKAIEFCKSGILLASQTNHTSELAKLSKKFEQCEKLAKDKAAQSQLAPP